MYSLVKHFCSDATPVTIRQLSENEVTAIISTEHDNHQVTLSVIHSQKAWVLCPCGIPTTVKRMSQSNQCHLVKVQDRDMHKGTCPLYSLSHGTTSNGNLIARASSTSFSFAKLSNRAGKGEESLIEAHSAANSSNSADQLFSLAASLFTDAKVNRINMNGGTFKEDSMKIKKASTRFSLGGKSLYDYLFFGFGKMKEAKEYLRKKRGCFTVDINHRHYYFVIFLRWSVMTNSSIPLLSKSAMVRVLSGK